MGAGKSVYKTVVMRGERSMADIEVKEQESFITRPFLVSMLECIKRFYDDPENWKRYAAWHQKKYGCAPKRAYGQVEEHRTASGNRIADKERSAKNEGHTN